MRCLDDETVLGLVEGRLAPPWPAAIDEHLDTCESCRDVISQVARVQSPSRVLGPGLALGRYVIGELVGTGAMGRVYAAWEPELDRRVAIKVLQDDAPGARDRLVREAQAMARLDHPNVVGVHEVGTTEHGVYVAMDLVDGETLRGWAVHRPGWREVARVLAEVARGLAAVHAAGVLHRDVKPDNVIVGADGRARLGDFGLARSGTSLATSPRPKDASSPRASSALANGTPATSVAGTPAYMAPEVLRGHAATAASDQFGFGVTAYEVLAGRRPFTGTTWAELASTIDREPPARLPAAPGWLDAAIRRCLAVDPARRFASMTEVAALLEERARRGGPTLWIAAAVTTAMLASGATWLAVHEPAARSCELGAGQIASVWNDAARQRLGLDTPVAASIARWTAAWITARDTVCRAGEYEPPAVIAARDRCLDGRRAELAALLERVAASRSAAERLGDALATLPPSECTSLAPGGADPLPLDPAAAVAVRDIARELPGVRAAIALGDARPVAATVAQLVERARASGHAPTLAETLLLHAEAARATADLAAAALAARDAVAAAERGHDDLAAARAWIARMTIAGDRRDLAATDDLAAIAEAAIDRAGAPPHLAAQLLRIRGLVAYNRGELVLSRALLGEARTAYAELAGERSFEVAAVLSSLGTVERAAGDLDAAERHHRLALALDRELRGDRHPDVARDLHNLAGVARLRGEHDVAVTLYREALALEDALRGPTSVESALTHNSLGLVHMARRDWAAAEIELALARNALRAAGHGDLAFAEHNSGLVMAARGRHAEALAHFERAAAAYAATIGDAAAAPIRLHLDRARSELALGRTAAARSHAAQARDAATRAGLAWIVAEAAAFLAEPRPRPRAPASAHQPLVIEPPPAVVTPGPTPQAATESPVPPPPPPAVPKPGRDVGVYGSSQGW